MKLHLVGSPTGPAARGTLHIAKQPEDLPHGHPLPAVTIEIEQSDVNTLGQVAMNAGVFVCWCGDWS